MIKLDDWATILSTAETTKENTTVPDMWRDILKPASIFAQQPLRKTRASTHVIQYQKTKTRKKRRPRMYNSDMKVPSVIGSCHGHVTTPVNTIEDCPLAIVNAITGRLPLMGQIRLFGIPIYIQLTGVLYRHKKLTWILKHSLSNTEYLSCHFLADITHILHQIRHQFTCIAKHKKYNRQSFNAATCVFESKDHRTLQQNPFILTEFGHCVLQLSGMQYDVHKINAFLEQRDSPRNFLRIFSPTPVTSHSYTSSYTTRCRGWKTYTTLNAKHECNGGRRQKCTCKQLISLITQKKTDREKLNTLLLHLPSTLI